MGILIALMVVALGVLYRVVPNRLRRGPWVSVGGVVMALLLWFARWRGFSLYINFLGDNKTYSAVTGVALLLLGHFLTSYIVLLGMQINAWAEYQTARDSAVGAPKPRGQRGAVIADTMTGYPRG